VHFVCLLCDFVVLFYHPTLVFVLDFNPTPKQNRSGPSGWHQAEKLPHYVKGTKLMIMMLMMMIRRTMTMMTMTMMTTTAITITMAMTD